jgi:hypothetical protein
MIFKHRKYNEFHTSAAAVLKNGQFNRKRNFVGSYLLFLIVGAVFACIPLLFSGATAITRVIVAGGHSHQPLITT